MPRDNRGVLPTAAGLIVLVIAFGLGCYVTALNYPEEDRYQNYRYASDKPLQIDPASLPTANTQTFENPKPCQNPKGEGESDLCAYWRAANAAEDSAFWAQCSFWIACFGIAGLVVTLWFNLQAWQQAKSAQTDTEAALKHAETNAKAVTNIVEALPVIERAHLYPEIVALPPLNDLVGAASASFGIASEIDDTALQDTAEISFVINNHGKTPAVLRAVYSRIGVGDIDILRASIIKRPILGPNEETERLISEMELGITPRQARDIMAYHQSINFVGDIVFFDVWGEEFTTKFHFQWDNGNKSMELVGIKTCRNAIPHEVFRA